MLKILYVTCPDKAHAVHIAKVLLEQRLIACANILGDMTSLYHWQGTIEESSEVVLLCKTHETRVEAAQDLILEHHPYTCPCVLVLPVEGGNPLFAEWIKKEIQKD
jgi:periplasmic divalent cation tolerance protein